MPRKKFHFGGWWNHVCAAAIREKNRALRRQRNTAVGVGVCSGSRDFGATTMSDPYMPPGRYDPPGTNPPRHQLSHHDASWSSAKVGGAILVAGLLAAGAFMWATHGGYDTTTAANPPPQTSGQGGAKTDQKAPRPAPQQ
jgi:hypothetical protein